MITRATVAGLGWRLAALVVGVVAAVGPYAVAVTGLTADQAVKLVLAIAVLALAVYSCWHPQVAVFAVIFVAPFEQEIKVAGLVTGTVELSLIAFLPGLALGIRRATLPRPVTWSLIALVFGSLLSVFYAPSPGFALWGAARWALVAVFVLAVISYLGTRNNGLERLVVSLALVGSVVGVFALLQRAGFYFVVGKPWQSEHPDSTFGYYTVYASFMAMAATVAIGALLIGTRVPRSRLVTAFLAGTAVLALYCVAFSLSRGALIALAVGVLGCLLVAFRRVVAALWAIIGLISSIGLVLWLSSAATISSYSDRFDDSRGSDLIRFSLQAAARQLISSNPLGIGYLNFEQYVSSGVVSARQALAHAHSLFLQMALDAGWIGVIAFAALCATALVGAARAVRLRDEVDRIKVVFGAAILGYLAQGVGDYLFYELTSQLYFALLIACASAAHHPGEVVGAGEVDPVRGLEAASAGRPSTIAGRVQGPPGRWRREAHRRSSPRPAAGRV